MKNIQNRAIILLMDSFGLGASLDAANYDSQNADTFGHIVEACVVGKGNLSGLRQGPLKIPHLTKLGLAYVALASTGKKLPGMDYELPASGLYGYAVEKSLGKDTPSGHWEIAGVPVLFEWGYFRETLNCFPKALIKDLIEQANLPGILGNCHASGTEIIKQLGDEHIKTGKPIVYTSADSVFQIAAHEETFGLKPLYDLCEIARKLVNAYNIGRVIARPFIGKNGDFKRTGNRKDLSIAPPSPTLLDRLVSAGGEVISVGKTADIFAHQGITKKIKADGNMALFDETLKAIKTSNKGTLIFTNFVDFDSVYGHRRDIPGYAAALEAFDKRLPELFATLKKGDLVVITADHGCDPTFKGSDHTREHIPVLAFGPDIPAQFIGRRDSFADIGQSIAKHLGLAPLDYGNSFI
ncbi:MAG: phosphopentomutase [Gammaproteobacteria bacterium]